MRKSVEFQFIKIATVSWWTRRHRFCDTPSYFISQINGSVQGRRNSIANTLELCLSCTNPSTQDILCSLVSHHLFILTSHCPVGWRSWVQPQCVSHWCSGPTHAGNSMVEYGTGPRQSCWDLYGKPSCRFCTEKREWNDNRKVVNFSSYHFLTLTQKFMWSMVVNDYAMIAISRGNGHSLRTWRKPGSYNWRWQWEVQTINDWHQRNLQGNSYGS